MRDARPGWPPRRQRVGGNYARCARMASGTAESRGRTRPGQKEVASGLALSIATMPRSTSCAAWLGTGCALLNRVREHAALGQRFGERELPAGGLLTRPTVFADHLADASGER